MKRTKQTEQVISIALFDILGFSNMVEQKSAQTILDLYNKLREYLSEKSVEGGWVTAVPYDGVWSGGANKLVGVLYPLAIHSAYASDTFMMWADISQMRGHPDATALHIFLDAVQWFFCKALENGIPLRGAVATGEALMDKEKSIYFGKALVEAAKGENAQLAIGISYGPSVIKYPPMLSSYILPFSSHIKNGKEALLSKRIVNWVHFWENNKEFSGTDVIDRINKMNLETNFSIYYETAIKIVNFA